MRRALYAATVVVGIAIGLLGSEPLWIPAVAALLAFPIAAAVAARTPPPGRRQREVPLGAAVITALAGGLLAALAIRLAVLAPDWLSAGAADCGTASTATQEAVLWASALVFAAAAVPVTLTLLSIGRRLAPGGSAVPPSSSLNIYPVAVAASGLALVAAGYVTTC